MPRFTVVVVLGLNLSLYSLPGSARRQALTAELAQHQRLSERLAEAGVDAVLGISGWSII
ncbi:MAG: hypothetical protein ACLQF1_10185 [Methyloceanibacter sp.]